MLGTLAAATTAVIVFATTNVDDLALLSMFFADRAYRPRNVVVGQFVGITALVAASALGAFAALALPPGWLALVGLAPLGLGVHKLVQFWRKRDAAGEALPRRPRSLQVLAVASVTIANGGDNIAVYVPLFAANQNAIRIYVAVFAGMTGMWCAAGYFLVNNARFGARVARYGHVLLPFILIGIGAHILAGARGLFP